MSNQLVFLNSPELLVINVKPFLQSFWPHFKAKAVKQKETAETFSKSFAE